MLTKFIVLAELLFIVIAGLFIFVNQREVALALSYWDDEYIVPNSKLWLVPGNQYLGKVEQVELLVAKVINTTVISNQEVRIEYDPVNDDASSTEIINVGKELARGVYKQTWVIPSQNPDHPALMNADDSIFELTIPILLPEELSADSEWFNELNGTQIQLEVITDLVTGESIPSKLTYKQMI